MKAYIIDTNALISFVTDRNLDQQAMMATLFDQAAGLACKILCHSHVLTEFVYVLDRVYAIDKGSIRRMIMDLIGMAGIEITYDIDFSMLLECWPDAVSDFGDAVVASLWFQHRYASVVTFDQRFIKELKKMDVRVYENDAFG